MCGHFHEVCCCCRENELSETSFLFSGCAVRLVDSAVFNDGTLLANARISRTLTPVSRPRSGAVRAKQELWRLSWRCRGGGEKRNEPRRISEVETNRLDDDEKGTWWICSCVYTKCQSARGFATWFTTIVMRNDTLTRITPLNRMSCSLTVVRRSLISPGIRPIFIPLLHPPQK